MKVNDLMSTEAIEILQEIVDAYVETEDDCDFGVEVDHILNKHHLVEETDGDET